MVRSIFKAYDVRGEYPREVNEVVVRRIGLALGRFFTHGKVVVGHDGRLSSPALYRALKAGLAAGGVSAGRLIAVSLSTTPMLYFAVHRMKAAGGVMVTASHNPAPMNGLKVVGKDAAPMSGFSVEKLLRVGVEATR